MHGDTASPFDRPSNSNAQPSTWWLAGMADEPIPQKLLLHAYHDFDSHHSRTAELSYEVTQSRYFL